MTDKPKRLGRGLGALISAANSTTSPSRAETQPAQDSSPGPFQLVPIGRVSPNPFQPRRSFKPEELTELEASLRASGLLQPISVRPTDDGRFELVAGERRLRAATRLGWTEIPAIVKPIDNREMLVLALVENLQRADLNPIDEALGYERLMAEFKHTQQQVADAVGKDRSTIANMLRVLTLPEGIRTLVRDGQISLGHARALLALGNERTMIETARRIIDDQLSVREVERMAADQRTRPAGAPPSSPSPSERVSRTSTAEAAELKRLTELLRRRLQTDVKIELHGDSKGVVALHFYSTDDLHRLLELVLGTRLDIL